eukprot:SAG31_NODE_791_length_12069_cov_22.664411_7_plen_238_part_00
MLGRFLVTGDFKVVNITGVIGHFVDVNVGEHLNRMQANVGLDLLTAVADAEKNPSRYHAASIAIAQQLGAERGGTEQPGESSFNVLRGPLLDKAACTALIQLMDKAYHGNANQDLDFKLEIEAAALGAAIGVSSATKLCQIFQGAGGRLDSLRLRRVAVRGKVIPFHVDKPTIKTMQIALNSDHEYTGGRLAFATTRGLEIPSRPAGSATIHGDDVVHGVTELTNGVRYSLFLLHLR